MIGDQRRGRGVRIGQDLNVETGVAIETLIAGDEEADVVGVRRPVQGDAHLLAIGGVASRGRKCKGCQREKGVASGD